MASYHPLGFFLLILFYVSTYFSMSCAQVESTTRPEVTISQGTLLGITVTTLHGRNVSAFLGIPYGQPPTGNLRFANPVPAERWNETRDASAYGSWCPQYLPGGTVGEEDCLYLNVFTPQLSEATHSSLLPVMVFIHGGGFQVGSSNQAGPQYLLDADVVLVAMNYRLGPLGFLSTGDEVASGNWGLKDQILALQWVQNNIGYFGGDPDQVTLFGESAGAVSVHLLTLSTSTTGLFHKYITQSGSALGAWAYAPRAAYSRLAFKLGEYVGCSNDTSESLISCLRETIDVSDIISTFPQFMVWGSFPGIFWMSTDEPDIEGAILTDSPSNLLAAGQIRDLPWMSGICRDEGLIHSAGFYGNKERFLDFLENFDTLLPMMMIWTYQLDSGAAWTRAVKSYYFNDDLTTNTSLVSDDQVCIVNHIINYCTLNDPLFRLHLEMVDTMVQLWTSFAINGIPTATVLETAGKTWEPFSTEDAYLRIGNDSDTALELQYSFFRERMEFWANLDTAVDSGTATSSPNFVHLVLAAFSKFVLF